MAPTASTKFADADGREWSLRITTADLRPLRAVGWDLNPKAGKIPLDPLGDPEMLGAVLWTLCEPQAAARGLTPEQFARGFDGPANWAACQALLAAAADFSQPPGTAAQTKASLPGVMSRMDAELSERMTADLTSSSSAGNSAGSPASTPGPSPSGS